jgi:hypothetical protein
MSTRSLGSGRVAPHASRLPWDPIGSPCTGRRWTGDDRLDAEPSLNRAGGSIGLSSLDVRLIPRRPSRSRRWAAHIASTLFA